MTEKNQATRLGDILLEKGLLQPAQLRIAIAEQQQRRQSIAADDKNSLDASSLGEILIELEFITRVQLKRALSWQMSLRRMTIAMALCAPLMSFGVGAAASTASGQTGSSKASASISLPATIQAENYSTMYGIQTEPTTDVGGGLNVGYIHADDWLIYGNTEVSVPATGNYKVTYRVASPSGGGRFTLHEADSSQLIDDVVVPATGGTQVWVDVVRNIQLTAGTHKFAITALERGSSYNINWFRIEAVTAAAASSSTQSISAQAPAVGPSSSSSKFSSSPSSAAAVSSVALSSLASTAASSAATSSAVSPAASSASSLGATLPVTIQAEDFTSMFGISTETTSDLGGGLNVGYIHPNDWLSYAGKGIDAPVAGNYKVIFRVASPGGGGSFALHEADGSLQYGIVNVPNTGAWQQWVDVEKTIYLSAGKHSFGVAALTRGTGFNFNWFKVEFKGLALPVTIEAENYAAMYGVVTETTSDAGGGLNVGYIHPADWMSYANIKIDIPAAGSYRVTYRVASPATGGSFALHEADGSQQYDTVAVPATGGWQKWVDVERVITLSAGVHSLGITAITRGQGYNLNWFRLEALSSSGGAASAASSVTSSAAVSSSAAASSIKTLSSSSSSSSSVSSSSAASSVSGVGTIQVVGPVAFRWEIPTQRENGSRLDITELGGYELRYKRPADSSFIYISINDAWQNEYNFLWLEGEYIFQVAAFDKNGIYSNFVDIAPQ